jgi:Neutral/alkaline non-lysosomal ceramidase, N-terminal
MSRLGILRQVRAYGIIASQLNRRLAMIYALIALGLLTPPLDASSWKAGAAKVVITPEGPIWMAGYASRDKPSAGKLHDLWAKALVIEDPNGSRALLVTLDLCGIDRDFSLGVRKRIEAKHGLSIDRVALTCSHTHSGPVTKANLIGMYPLDDAQRKVINEYTQSLADNILKAADEAIASIGPASLSFSTGWANWAVNRRDNPEAQVEELRKTLSLKGPVDHDVPVLSVTRDDGQTVAIVCGYACHCTVLSGYDLSGDYAGFAQIRVEERIPGAIAMFWAGCGADQNPLPRRTIELAKDYGERLARSVLDAVVDSSSKGIKGPLSTSYREIDLAFAPLPDRAHWEAEAKSDQLAFANRAKTLLDKIDRDGSLPTTYPYPVQVWRFGDDEAALTWVFLGGEVTVDYALRIKRNLDESRTWVTAYANDVMAYIPSLRVLKEGGYEGGGAMVYYGLPGPWSEQVEEQVIGAVTDLIQP